MKCASVSVQAQAALRVGFTDHDSNQSLGHDVSPHGALQLDGAENAPDEALFLDAVHLPCAAQQFPPRASRTNLAALRRAARCEHGLLVSGCHSNAVTVRCNTRRCPPEGANVSLYPTFFAAPHFSPRISLLTHFALCLQLPANST